MSRTLAWTRGLAVIAAAASISACADRGQMYSEDRPATAATASPESDSQVSATGCFQKMSGFDNFVLSNVGDAPGVEPSTTRSYRIEQRGEFEQYVGKQVTVAGRVDSGDAARGMPAGKAVSGDVDFNDLPELHVESVTVVSENCGNARQ